MVNHRAADDQATTVLGIPAARHHLCGLFPVRVFPQSVELDQSPGDPLLRTGGRVCIRPHARIRSQSFQAGGAH